MCVHVTALVLGAISSRVHAQGLSGEITGVLKGDDGLAISHALVSLNRVAQPTAVKHQKSLWSVESSTDGSFRFTGIYDGQYRVCVQVPGSTWLNPCEWEATGPEVSVSGGRAPAKVNMVLRQGVVVPIRIDDPGGRLLKYEGKIPGALVLLGLSTGSSFRVASGGTKDSNGRNHRIVIPFDTPVSLVAFSSFFQLSDPSGNHGPKGTSTRISISVPKGTQPDTVTFTVVDDGVKEGK